MSLSNLHGAINRSHSLILEALILEFEVSSFPHSALEELMSALGHLMNASDHVFNRDLALIRHDIGKADLESGLEEVES